MKLVDKFTLWFIGIIVLTTPVTAYICYYNLEKNIDKPEIARLKEMNDRTAGLLSKGVPLSELGKSPATTVTPLSAALPGQKMQVHKKNMDGESLQSGLCLLTVDSYVSINNAGYKISSFNYVPSSDLIIKSIRETIGWKLLLIIICIGITARLVSHRIFRLLRKTMKLIQGFDLKQKVQFPKKGAKEFRELNGFLQRMTDKAVDEYVAVKEFSENASHELQTPLAILRNKLELLSETNIEAGQAELLSDMQNAIEKLTKIHRSLTLLAKMENNEYTVSENIRFCRIAKEVLAAYEDRIEMKNLSITTNIDKNILLKIHPQLADILMNNLLGNAIRHNIQNGLIDLSLTQKRLLVKNTGLPPEMPTDELFQRFKKSDQSSESVGLGLSIVRQICEVCNFRISYQYKNELHILRVDFQQTFRPEEIPVTQDNLDPAVL
jgi:two-component system sensor histidine kinase QseC